MPETLWRASLVLALYRNRHVAQARYLQLATVRDDGRPANRSVVFRGFLADTDSITMVTDTRSAKVRGLEAVPWAEACWFFPMTREQFRLGGRAVVVRRGLGRRGARACSPRRLRAGRGDPPEFHLAGAGEPRDPNVPFVETTTDPESPPPTFGLIVLDPAEVDHLELDGSPQNRWTYRRDEGGRWTAQEINP